MSLVPRPEFVERRRLQGSAVGRQRVSMSRIIAMLVIAGLSFLFPLVVVAPIALVLLGLAWVAERAGVDTTVENGLLTVRVIPGRTRRVPCREIAEVELTVDDLAAGLFGGWSTRTHGVGPYSRTQRSFGNQGVRVVQRDGREFLVGSFRPDELLDAIQAQGGPRPTASS
jgi:hypothetical protein